MNITASTHQPLVTVVIVCYKHASYVKQSIMSVLEQSYSSIELIVVDDESPDDSPLLIKELAVQYKFKTIFQKNSGLTAALNKSIELAAGKYFVYLAADDNMYLDRLEKQVTFMECNPQYAVCAGNAVIINENGDIIKKQDFHPARELTFNDIFMHSKAGIRAPTAMIKTDILREVGGYDPTIALEDIYMWLKITSKGYVLYVMDDVLTYYRKHSSNQSKNIVFMADCMTAIYADYQSHPAYRTVMNTLLINLFFKAAKRRYPNAMVVLKRVPWQHYNFKVLLGLCYYAFNQLLHRFRS